MQAHNTMVGISAERAYKTPCSSNVRPYTSLLTSESLAVLLGSSQIRSEARILVQVAYWRWWLRGDLRKHYGPVETGDRKGSLGEWFTALDSWGSVHPPTPPQILCEAV